jgi:hypothetical protein
VALHVASRFNHVRRVTTHSPLGSSARFLVEPLYPRCTAVQLTSQCMVADGDKIKLTYWDAAGRGEAVRVTLRVAGIQFTDERIKTFAGQAHCTALHRRLLCKHQHPCPPSESPPSPVHQLQAALPPAFAWGWPRVHAQESVIDLLGKSTRV